MEACNVQPPLVLMQTDCKFIKSGNGKGLETMAGLTLEHSCHIVCLRPGLLPGLSWNKTVQLLCTTLTHCYSECERHLVCWDSLDIRITWSHHKGQQLMAQTWTKHTNTAVPPPHTYLSAYALWLIKWWLGLKQQGSSWDFEFGKHYVGVTFTSTFKYLSA